MAFSFYAGKPQLTCNQSLSPTVKSGSSFLTECAVSGSPVPDIVWLYNNKPISTDKVKIAETYTTLSLPRITPEEAGKYTVRAENKAGKDELVFSISVISMFSVLVVF